MSHGACLFGEEMWLWVMEEEKEEGVGMVLYNGEKIASAIDKDNRNSSKIIFVKLNSIKI